MQLIKENAHLYENKFLDVERRLFHHYPLCVKRNSNGKLMVVDNTGTWMEIPTEKDIHKNTFDGFEFDFVVEKSDSE